MYIFTDSTNSGDGMYGMMKGGPGLPGMPGVSQGTCWGVLGSVNAPVGNSRGMSGLMGVS